MRRYPAFEGPTDRTVAFPSVGTPLGTIAFRRYPQFLEVDRVMRVWEFPSGTAGAGGNFLSRLTLLGAG